MLKRRHTRNDRSSGTESAARLICNGLFGIKYICFSFIPPRPHMSFHQLPMYVDGSFSYAQQLGGAGVFFAHDDPDNCQARVPRKKQFCPSRRRMVDDPHAPYDPLRAELYAALLGMHAIRTRKHVHSPRVSIVLRQDSQLALTLLSHCFTLDEAPTRWAHRPQHAGWRCDFPWGSSLHAASILDYGDILDAWWSWTRKLNVRFEWIKAHQLPPCPCKQQALRQWDGNRHADEFAKQVTQWPCRDDLNTTSVHLPMGSAGEWV